VNALKDRIARLIRASGPITVAQYVTICLHDPEQGYYATREPLGARGDFITAPEISQMFGELIGLWCAQVWLDQGKSQPPQMVELGPGRGTLMADALRALRTVPRFLSGCRVTMVEASQRLRRSQEESLRDASVPIEWTSHFIAPPTPGPVFVLANEFFDALPVRQFVKTESGWHERQIGVNDDDDLTWLLAPVAADEVIPADRRSSPQDAVFERCEQAIALVEEIARAVNARGGGALVIDYGYGSENPDQTIQAVSAHKSVPLLEQPGNADLSAHVDFRALAQAAEQAGASVFGPLEQGRFLRALGIEARADRLGRSQSVSAALNRLTHTAEMGTLFKALAIVPRDAPLPPGFS